nr:MAG TPA: hypothetical protein [Caudoviricetes sp.]DAN58708.1 MAG TPA: hypothetical protein [Caudoviricetes sp.]
MLVGLLRVQESQDQSFISIQQKKMANEETQILDYHERNNRF